MADASPGDLASVEDLVAAIRRYISAWNRRCQPRAWKDEADQIWPSSTLTPTPPPSRWAPRPRVGRFLSGRGDGQQVARFPHTPWPIGASGCCAFSPDGHSLWAVVPPRPERFFAGSAELWLIDLRVMRVVDWRKLEASPAGCHPVRHPDGQTVGLDIGECQDGSLIRWARADRGRIDLRFALDSEQGLMAVHPDGQEYLTTPHPCGADRLVRHHFPDDRPIEELAAADVLGSDERWDFHAGYLTDTLILASIVETDQHSGRHVLVQRTPMRLLGDLVYPAGQPPGWIAGPNQGSWLTVDDRGLKRWTLAG